MFRVHPRVNSILFTIMHFLVDGICGLVLFSTLLLNIDNQSKIIILLVYNCLAFVSQPLFGFLIDLGENHEKYYLLGALILIYLGVAFKYSSITSAILLGLGNSIFHISGGKYVIDKSDNNIIDLGIFVSSGALGLAIGCNFSNEWIWPTFLTPLAFIAMFVIMSEETTKIKNDKFKNIYDQLSANEVFLLLILICIAVLIRLYLGSAVNYKFEKTTLVLVLMGLASTLGKALGGVIAKFIGINKTIIISMFISMLLLIFGNINVYASLIGIFFFNMSMPLTLYLANNVIKKQGFAFGLLAAFLVPGYLLGLIKLNDIAIKVMIALLSIATILIVITVNTIINKTRDNFKDKTYE